MRHPKHILQWSLIPAWIVMAGAALYETYLLEGRPAVSLNVPDQPPADWHCGRSIGPRHCVTISPFEQELWADWVRVMILYSGPVILLNLLCFRKLGIDGIEKQGE